MSESPRDRLLRICQEEQHRRLDRLERDIRRQERNEMVKHTITAPLRWLYNVMTGQ